MAIIKKFNLALTNLEVFESEGGDDSESRRQDQEDESYHNQKSVPNILVNTPLEELDLGLNSDDNLLLMS